MSKSAATEWTYDHLVKQYCDFLLIALHSICFYRRLYDSEFFSLVRAYNCPVQKCRHPLLQEYLNSVVSAVAEELRRCTVHHITVVILSSQDVALERFVFDVSSLPVIAPDEIFLPFKDTEYQVGQLDGQFRAAMMKLALVETRLGPVPDDCTFTVNIELRKNGPTVKNTSSWIEAEDIQVPETPHGKQLVPLRRIAFGPIKLDSWVEETKAKLKLPASNSHTSRASDEIMDLSF